MLRILALGLTLLGFAGCGGGDRPPASVVPADATIYVGVDDAQVERLIDATSSDDIDFERDVRPWLGDRAAYFVDAAGDESGIVLAAIDGHLVIAGTRELLQAAEAAADDRSLADAKRLDVAGEDEDGAPDIRVDLNLGTRPGGAADDLGDTPRYQDAERRLGGAPTLLVVERSSGYLAARDHTENGRRVVRIVQVRR